jgi:hypothetical protein
LSAYAEKDAHDIRDAIARDIWHDVVVESWNLLDKFWYIMETNRQERAEKERRRLDWRKDER